MNFNKKAWGAIQIYSAVCWIDLLARTNETEKRILFVIGTTLCLVFGILNLFESSKSS